MKEQVPSIDWFQLLDSRQQVFAAPSLERTITYLRTARSAGEGWGAYPKVGSDLHHSALAVQALVSSGDPSSIGLIADVASHFRKTTAPILGDLPLTDIANLLLITRCEQKPLDDAYTDELLLALQHTYERSVEGGKDIPVRLLAFVLLTVLELGRKDISLVTLWADRLLVLQCVDGGWPAVTGELSSLIVSASALRAVSRLGKNQAKEASRRGLNFLRSQLEKTGWQQLGSAGDTFTQAMVLLALAELPLDLYEIIREGVEVVGGSRNRDGSWGGGSGETGNIEITALALLALVAAGENRFVPASLARAALTGIGKQMEEITCERDNLRQEFEKRVQGECGKVVKERNDLLKLNETLNLRLRSVRKRRILEAEPDDEVTMVLEDDEGYPSYRESKGQASLTRTRALRFSGENLGRLLFSFALLFTITMAFYFSMKRPFPNSLWYVTGILVTGILAAVGLLVMFSDLRQKRRRRANSESANFELAAQRPELARLRLKYYELSESWPLSVREELAYRLFTELVGMPPEIGVRYSEDLAAKLGFGTKERKEFLVWVSRVMLLSSRDRRVLVTQLQRAYLR